MSWWVRKRGKREIVLSTLEIKAKTTNKCHGIFVGLEVIITLARESLDKMKFKTVLVSVSTVTTRCMIPALIVLANFGAHRFMLTDGSTSSIGDYRGSAGGELLAIRPSDERRASFESAW